MTGTLYAVRMQAGHIPTISAADLRHEWRNLDADRATGDTAHNLAKDFYAVWDDEKNMQQSKDIPGKGEGAAAPLPPAIMASLRNWAVNPARGKKRLLASRYNDCCINFSEDGDPVRDVVYALPQLLEHAETPAARRAAVDRLAHSLAAALNDGQSVRYYARLIWTAIGEELTGRRGLQVLAAQLARMEIDRREWLELKRPAALLAARLRAA